MGQNIFGTSFLRELTCRRRNIFFLTGIWGVAAIFSPRRRNKWRQFPRKEFFSAGSDDDDGVATFFSAEFPHSRFPKLVTFLFGGGRILGFPSKQKNIFSILRFIAHFSFDVKQFFRWEKNAIAWTVNPFLFLWNGPPGRKGKKRNLGSTSLQLSPQEICHSRNCLVDQRSPQKESKEFFKKRFLWGTNQRRYWLQRRIPIAILRHFDCPHSICSWTAQKIYPFFRWNFCGVRTCVRALVELFAKAESHSRTELAGNAIWSISSPENPPPPFPPPPIVWHVSKRQLKRRKRWIRKTPLSHFFLSRDRKTKNLKDSIAKCTQSTQRDQSSCSNACTHQLPNTETK